MPSGNLHTQDTGFLEVSSGVSRAEQGRGMHLAKACSAVHPRTAWEQATASTNPVVLCTMVLASCTNVRILHP